MLKEFSYESMGEHGGLWLISKLLDLVAGGWLQNCAATALMVAEAGGLTRRGYLTGKVSQQIKVLLAERASEWMTSAQLLTV